MRVEESFIADRTPATPGWYLLVNVGLVMAQGVLLLRTYDRRLWDLMRPSHREPGQPMIPTGR